MIKTSLLCFFVSLFAVAGAQGKVVVHISNFRNNNGSCLVAIYDNAGAFTGKGSPVKYLCAAITGHQAEATIENLPAGTYAISVIHDANNNKRFDTNFIGIPTEGYGASRNKLPFAAAPKFDANKFSIDGNASMSVNIRLRYLL